MKNQLNEYIKVLKKYEGSDLHLKAGSVPRIRINGGFRAIGNETLSPALMEEMTQDILYAHRYEKLVEDKELDHAFTLEDGHRIRVNFYYHIGGLGAVFRILPSSVMALESLNMPHGVFDLIGLSSGLVLITGISGSGKTTTMSSILDHINQTDTKHIVSLENPVEIIHRDKKSFVSQRVIGENVLSLSASIHSVMQEDVDVLFISKLDNRETIEAALQAACSGHLVFAGLCTRNIKETLGSLISYFTEEERDHIRHILANVLEGIIAQRMVTDREGQKVAAVGIMKKTARISELIAENRISEIAAVIQKSDKTYNVRTLDQAILDLYRRHIVEKEEAINHATDRTAMSLAIEGIQNASAYHPNAQHA